MCALAVGLPLIEEVKDCVLLCVLGSSCALLLARSEMWKNLNDSFDIIASLTPLCLLSPGKGCICMCYPCLGIVAGGCVGGMNPCGDLNSDSEYLCKLQFACRGIVLFVCGCLVIIQLSYD